MIERQNAAQNDAFERARLPRTRICVLSEDLSGAPDEGVKKFVWQVARALAGEHEVRILSTEAVGRESGAMYAPAPRSFVSGSLRAALRSYRPSIVLYVARSSTTFASFVRSRVLRAYCPRAKVVLVGLQARELGGTARFLIRLLRPDLIFAQSEESRRYLRQLGCSVELVNSGVDLEVFSPVDLARRQVLRARYGFADDRPVVLHVGHLQHGRGIGVLAKLAATRRCQVALVASSSTDQEKGLAEELRRAGVRVFTEYLAHVEHLYQLADCYVFPVELTDHAIEVPLSVLEAFGCDRPVVTTRFGGLPRLYANAGCPGLSFVDSGEEIPAEALRLCDLARAETRPLALPYSWNAVASQLLDHALRKEAARA